MEAWEVLDLLQSLVDKSLVVYEENADGQGRYRLLETVRQYANDKLTTSQEAAVVQERHCTYYLGYLTTIEPMLAGARQAEGLSALAQEHDNARAGIRYSLHRQDTETGFAFARGLQRFWGMRGHLEEGRACAEALLTLDERNAPSPARGVVLHGTAILAYKQADYLAARAMLEQSIAIFLQFGDEARRMASLHALGNVAYFQGDFAAAQTTYEQSRALAQERNDLRGETLAWHALGNLAYQRRDFTEAGRCYEQSLVRARSLGDAQALAQALLCCGIIAAEQEEYVRAKPFFDKALTTLLQLQDQHGIANVLHNQAHLFVLQNRIRPASRLYGAHDSLRDRLKSPVHLSDKADYDQDIALCRATLGETTFQQEYNQGRMLDSEAAVQFALDASEAAL